MKICYVANSRFPSERAHMTQIVHMCNAFAQKGHEVILYVTDRKTSIDSSPEKFWGLKLRFQIKRIHVPDIVGVIHRIPKLLRPFFFHIQRFIFSVRVSRDINREKLDHIYGRDEWVLWFLSKLAQIRFTWESHEAKFPWVAKRIIKKSKKFVVISEGIRDYYIKQGISKNQILVAHDAIDDSFFIDTPSKEEMCTELGIKTTKPVVLYIGGLDMWKGVTTLFQASILGQEYQVCVIGGKKKEIERYKEEYPNIIFLGQKPYRELPRNQQAADVLVIPNTSKNKLSSEYTSPLKLFAHMTSKVPIVVSRIKSMENVLNDDEVYFFTPDNPESLHGTILTALDHMDLSEQKAKKVYKKSLSYTWKKRSANILRFIYE